MTNGASRFSFRRIFVQAAEISGIRDPRTPALLPARNFFSPGTSSVLQRGRLIMGFGRGALLWLLGIPLPIVLLLALFWHH